MNLINVLATVILAIVVWQILIFSPNTTDETVTKQPTTMIDQDIDPESAQWMSGVHLVESQSGEREWELWAEKAKAQDENGDWKLSQVKVQFYSDGVSTMTVLGDAGSINATTKDMRVEGNVRSKSNNGYVFETNSLDYTSAGKRLETTDAVRMVGPKVGGRSSFRLKGEHLVANLSSGKVEVRKSVKTRMLRKDREFSVNSRTAEFSLNSRKAEYRGNVVIDVDTLRVTGPAASFQYKKRSNELKSVKVDGGIRVSDLDKWATSNTVDIEFDSDKFIFTGSPKLVQNNDELIGEVITFLNGGKRVKVDRARARVDKEDLDDTN